MPPYVCYTKWWNLKFLVLRWHGLILPVEHFSTESSGKRSSVFMALILLLTVAAVALSGYMKSKGIELKDIDVRQFLSGNNMRLLDETSGIVEIPYDSKEHPVFGTYSEYIIKCSKDGILFLDKKGREIWSLSIPLNNPLVKTNGRDLLVADIGGRDIYVINGKNVLWKDKTEENIHNAEINENGYVTAITGSRIYNGEISTYDNHGIELFRTFIASDFAVNAKISPSANQMAVNLINASGVKSFSYIKFFDINGKELAAKNMPQGEGIFPFVWFAEKDLVIAAGGKSIICLDKDRNIIWDKKFTKIAGASVLKSSRIAAAVENENTSEIKVFTENGKEYSSVQLNDEVQNISVYGGIIAGNTLRGVYFMTEKGKVKCRYNSKSDITNVLFFSGQQAAVVTSSYVAVVDIN